MLKEGLLFSTALLFVMLCLCVVVEQVSEVRRGLIMEGCVSEKNDFELDALWNSGPVEILQYRDYMVTQMGESEKTSSTVSNVLAAGEFKGQEMWSGF